MPDLRLRYAKEGNLRFISHLDLVRGFERAFRRGGLPIAFSEGYHPHPLMSFGPALPLGIESSAEYLDLTLTQQMEAQDLHDRLNGAFPEGLRIMEVKPITRKVKPLTAVINRATYRITAMDQTEPHVVYDCIDKLWNNPHIEVSRRSKNGGEKLVDIRPLWHHWEPVKVSQGFVGEIEVEVGSHGTIRPDEFLRLATIPDGGASRLGLWIVNGATRLTPMDLC